MTRVQYGSTHSLKDKEIETYLEVLPPFMQKEIKTYRFLSDQKSRIIARLMLFKRLKADGKLHLLDNWKRNSFGKPFIEGWNNFSITHSAEKVLFCDDKDAVGIDIEKVKLNNITDMSVFFTKEEQDYIFYSSNRINAFYEIWVKKESILKASGLGITNDLNTFNCIKSTVVLNQSKWYLFPIKLYKDYTSYLCSSNHQKEIKMERFFPNVIL